MVLELYNFEPHTLNEAAIMAKSEQLDEFWSFIKSDSKATLPLLRKELGTSSHSAFFYYDGSKLLLSLSKQKRDQSLALNAIPKADLRSIQHTDYLHTIQRLASNGLDTREAALERAAELLARGEAAIDQDRPGSGHVPAARVVAGNPEEVVAQLKPFVDAGYRHLICGFPAPYDEETMRRLATEVRPQLEALA